MIFIELIPRAGGTMVSSDATVAFSAPSLCPAFVGSCIPFSIDIIRFLHSVQVASSGRREMTGMPMIGTVTHVCRIASSDPLGRSTCPQVSVAAGVIPLILSGHADLRSCCSWELQEFTMPQ